MIRPARTSRVILPPLGWSMIPKGERYRELLHQTLAPWWGKIFGFHLLKLGALSADLDSSASPIQHHVAVAPEGPQLSVLADPDCLPFTNKAFDAALLAFTLDYASDPHAVLREVDRVLVDDGYLILIDCNPFSLAGIGRCVPLLRRRFPYQCRMFAPFRLTDWLHLLNYEVIHAEAMLPFPGRASSRRLAGFCTCHLPVLGSWRLLVARKRTIPLILTGSKRALNNPRMMYPVSACQQVNSPADSRCHPE